jgi:hypothetical protein
MPKRNTVNSQFKPVTMDAWAFAIRSDTGIDEGRISGRIPDTENSQISGRFEDIAILFS